MYTFEYKANLDICGFQNPIPIQCDYVRYHGFYARHTALGMAQAIVPTEVNNVHIRGVRANFEGIWMDITKILTQEQFDALADQILTSIED